MLGILAASVLRGFTGFGFGLAAVPLVSLALPPVQVVPLVATLQVVVGIGGLRQAIETCDWAAVRLLLPGLFLGVPIGLLILTSLSPDTVRLAIGLIVGFSVILLYRGARLPAKPSRLLTAGVGLIAGTISGLASMGGPPVIVYLMARGDSPTRIRATSIVYFMLTGCITTIPMVIRGLVTQQTLVLGLATLPVLFGGTWLGTFAFYHAKPQWHRATALITLTALAALLIVRALLRVNG